MKEPRFEVRPGEYVAFSHLTIPALQEIARGDIICIPGSADIDAHLSVSFAMIYAARLLKDFLS